MAGSGRSSLDSPAALSDVISPTLTNGCTGLAAFLQLQLTSQAHQELKQVPRISYLGLTALLVKKKKKKKKKESIKVISKGSSKLKVPTASHERAHQGTAAHGGTHTISTSGCRHRYPFKRKFGMVLA